MKIKALKTIVEHDGGQMVVINAGETGELSDEKAEAYIEGGAAEAVKAGKGKAKAEAAEAPAANEAEAAAAPAGDTAEDAPAA